MKRKYSSSESQRIDTPRLNGSTSNQMSSSQASGDVDSNPIQEEEEIVEVPSNDEICKIDFEIKSKNYNCQAVSCYSRLGPFILGKNGSSQCKL